MKPDTDNHGKGLLVIGIGIMVWIFCQPPTVCVCVSICSICRVSEMAVSVSTSPIPMVYAFLSCFSFFFQNSPVPLCDSQHYPQWNLIVLLPLKHVRKTVKVALPAYYQLSPSIIENKCRKGRFAFVVKKKYCSIIKDILTIYTLKKWRKHLYN